MTGVNRRTPRTLSLRALLLFTLVLPLVVATGFGGVWATDRRSDADAAQRLAAQVEVLSILGRLELSNDFTRLFRELDLVPDIRSLGVDPAALGDLRIRIDRLWDGGEALLANPEVLDRLTDGRGAALLRRVVDRHDAATGDASASSEGELVATAADLRRLVGLVRSGADTSAVASTAAFDLFGELQRSMLVEARQFLRALTGPAVTPSEAVRILELGAEQEALIDQIGPHLSSTLAVRFHDGLASDDVGLLRQAIAADAGIMSYPLRFRDTVTPERTARIVNRYLMLPEIRAEVAAGLHRRTLRTTEQADHWARAALILAASMGAITVATAVVVNRMVLQRLEQLGDAARRIAVGEVDESALPEDGAREIAEVAHAFNRMSQLLLTLERQVAALSVARLDDPSLGEPLPGRIGSELQQSVRLIAESNERLQHQASHDELTGLPNRAALADAMVTVAEVGSGPVALLCVDLHRFKYVNDVHGHRNGDQVIREVAARLAAIDGAEDVARIDGDEFAVVVRPGLADVAVEVAHLIVDELARPVAVAGERLVLQSSVGIAVSDSSRDATDLLRPAEVALSVAKSHGPGSVAVHDDAMSADVERRTRLEQRLRVALATDQLEMHAQPIVELASESIVGVELLARWRLDGEWIPPDVFIPIAEESGLIQSVGRWGLRRAVELAAELQAGGHRLHVSVNISGVHLLSGEVATQLAARLAERPDVDPSLLRIELTESELVTDPELAAERLTEIRRLGARAVIDDFGTGYSSLTYLHALPIDGIKLDRSFVERLDVDGADQTIVRMVTDLADGLGLDLVAEGVETAAQRDALLAHRYPKGQGYRWSRPVPLDRLWSLIEDLSSRRTSDSSDLPT